MNKKIYFFFLLLGGFYIVVTSGSGCAQIGVPSGGVKDTLPPVLVRSNPSNKTVNFKENKITLTFDEYIDLRELQSNVLISPVQKTNPSISSNLKTVNIKLKDTLLPNTTYSINFGNAIRDVNEGNVFSNFTYTFSTGSTIDSLSLNGKVAVAETGLVDSTLIVMLYRDADDSAVHKRKPNYITKIKGDGSFLFENLPAGNFKLYALKDGDGGKTYNSKIESFAFLDSSVSIPRDSPTPVLYAYEEQKPNPFKAPVLRPTIEKRLRYSTNLAAQTQDLLHPLELTFNNSLKVFDVQRIILSDTNYTRNNSAILTVDSTRKKISVQNAWKPEEAYVLILPKDVFTDTTGNTFLRSDTLKFKTKKITDYGTVVLRFKNVDFSRHPVIQFTEGTTVKYSYPLSSNEWINKLFPPGEYELRILFDDNNNGKWDPGNYSKKLQPEKASTLPQKISVRADWDNEKEITL